MTRIGRRLTIWVLGTGLLSLHATVFTLTIIGMVFWNIYDAPDDLWVADVFRRWGILLLFHAVAVAAGWTAWRLLRAEQHAIDANRTTWNSAADTTYPPIPVNAWQPPSMMQHVESPQPKSTLQQTGHSLKQFAAYSAVWTSKIGRAATGATQSVTSRFSGKKNASDAASGIPPAMPVQSWPQGPIRAEHDDELIARFGGQPTGATVPRITNLELPANGDARGDQTEGNASAPAIGKDAGQTWVEAATTGWLMPRDEEGSGPTIQNGSYPQIGKSVESTEESGS